MIQVLKTSDIVIAIVFLALQRAFATWCVKSMQVTDMQTAMFIGEPMRYMVLVNPSLQILSPFALVTARGFDYLIPDLV